MNNLRLQRTSLAYIVSLTVPKLFKVFQILDKNLKSYYVLLVLLECKAFSIESFISWISCVWVSSTAQGSFIVSPKLGIEKLNVSCRDLLNKTAHTCFCQHHKNYQCFKSFFLFSNWEIRYFLKIIQMFLIDNCNMTKAIVLISYYLRLIL